MVKQKISTKETGRVGEDIACRYLVSHGFTLMDRNVARKTGEIDLVLMKGAVLHFVEVKSIACTQLPAPSAPDAYQPAYNLHANKIRKVAKTAAWLAAERGWKGEWQVDGVLVWVCHPERVARAEYIPQIL